MSGNQQQHLRPGARHGVALILGSILSVMAMVMLAPALPVLMNQFRDVPDATFWVPALISLPGLGSALFSPFAGQVGDRFGRRVPLIGFCLLFAMAGVVPLFTSDFTVIFASRVIVGMAGAGALVLSTALIGDYFSGVSRDRWLAGQAMLATSAALILMPLGGLLTAMLGWRGPFIAFLAAAPLGLVYWILCHEPKAHAEEDQARSSWSDLPWRWLLGFCAITLCGAILLSILQLQIGLALKTVGINDAARIGGLSAIAVAGIPVGAVLFMRLVHIPFGRLISLEFLASGVTLVLLGYVSDYRIFLALAFLNLVAGGMILPTLITQVTQHLEARVRARGIGVWQAAMAAGQFLSVGLTSLIMRYPGTSVLDAFWLVGGGTMAASAIALLGIMSGRFSRVPTPELSV